MKKTLKIIILSALALSIFNGCTTKEAKPNIATTPIPTNVNTFETMSSTEVPSNTNRVDVICHNCRADFKLSQRIHGMSMKGDAIVDCPVCHQDYLKGRK